MQRVTYLPNTIIAQGGGGLGLFGLRGAGWGAIVHLTLLLDTWSR